MTALHAPPSHLNVGSQACGVDATGTAAWRRGIESLDPLSCPVIQTFESARGQLLQARNGLDLSALTKPCVARIAIIPDLYLTPAEKGVQRAGASLI